MASDDRIRVAALSGFHLEALGDWGFCDLKQEATLLRDIAAARVEANLPTIQQKLEYYARLYRKSIEELQRRRREAKLGNISYAELHRQLAAEAQREEQVSEIGHLSEGGEP